MVLYNVLDLADILKIHKTGFKKNDESFKVQQCFINLLNTNYYKAK